ncbi:MAG: CHAT domain-containing protein [candidate division KSB1 bacterium]|nr:CHAT domain-containing protein [candidate division KSB1 bacterium]MDZ7385198.1 CHAT domain-containing protein [candidate division KSB1 bacterium]MDZ7391841.1 CHAT domain-containing protein [candidate division KSB1 bacterium]
MWRCGPASLLLLLTALGWSQGIEQGFVEDFAGRRLGPAWHVIRWTGSPWSYHVPSQFSLTEHPGHLRFRLGAMVMDSPQPSFAGYWYYPSLSLRRRIHGTSWGCLIKVTYFLPLANMREFYTDIRFGSPDHPGLLLRFLRSRDIEPQFDVHTVTISGAEQSLQASILHAEDRWDREVFTYYYRVVREDRTLTVQWSADGSSYATALVFTMASELTREQWISISGSAWFTPSGSYADYDYVAVVPAGQLYSSEVALPEQVVCAEEPRLGTRTHTSISTRLAHLERLVKETEEVTPHLIDDEFKARFVASRMWVYEQVMAVLWELHQRYPHKGYQREAFRYAERAKARAFLQLLAEGKVHAHDEVSSGLTARQHQLLERLAELEERLSRKDLSEGHKRSAAQELSQTIAGLGNLRSELAHENPRYAQLLYPEPLPMDALQGDLPERAVFLQFFLGDQRSYLWAVTRDTVLMYALPSRGDIERHAAFYVDLLSATPPIASWAEAGHHLFCELFGQLPREMLRERHLIIAPDGVLNYLPFGALLIQTPDYFLANDCAISYAPSASARHMLRQWYDERPGSWQYQIVALGDPELPRQTWESASSFNLKRLKHARHEVKRVARLFPQHTALARVGHDANESFAKGQQVRHARFVHFATHSVLDETVLCRSGLLLAPDKEAGEDGHLRMSEVFDLRLDAELVVLSACQTARGRLFRGEGVRGLTSAFLYAGASSVLVSLWNVDDRSTQRLMEAFYRHLAQGVTKADALHRAQTELRRDKAYAHPFYWAPFVLIGDER